MDATTQQGSIGVGFDGSSSSTVALEWAVRRAVRLNRRLVVVHAAGDPARSSITLGTTETRRVLLQAAHRVAEQAAEVVRRLAPTLDVEMRTPPKAKEGVVVGVDGGATSSAVLDTAFELASLDGLPLHVVHNWAEVDLFVDRFSYEQRQEHGDAHERLLAEAVAGYAEKYPDVMVTRDTPDGNPIRPSARPDPDEPGRPGSRRLRPGRPDLHSAGRGRSCSPAPIRPGSGVML